MNDYEKLAQAIIKEQEKIVGPLAWSEAQKVGSVSTKDGAVSISGDGSKALASLAKQYETLFGQASIEACKDAVHPLLKTMKVKLPEILN